MNVLTPASSPVPAWLISLSPRCCCSSPPCRGIRSHQALVGTSYAKVAAVLAAAWRSITCCRFPAARATRAHRGEYASFITLIGSLFVIAGGIHLKVKGEAIRSTMSCSCSSAPCWPTSSAPPAPRWSSSGLHRMNKIRLSPHHIVFSSSSCRMSAGSLTPIGDPPLFLGYCAVSLLLVDEQSSRLVFTVGSILVAFYAFDLRSFRHAPLNIQEESPGRTRPGAFRRQITCSFSPRYGAVFVPDRYFLRELVMAGRPSPLPADRQDRAPGEHFSSGRSRRSPGSSSASSPLCCRPWITWRSTGRKSPSPAGPLLFRHRRAVLGARQTRRPT